MHTINAISSRKYNTILCTCIAASVKRVQTKLRSSSWSTYACSGWGTCGARRDAWQEGAGHGVDRHQGGASVETGVRNPEGFYLSLFWPAAARGAPGVGE